MTYIIGEACIDVKDISCQSVCPVDCIHETDRMLVIDAEECIDCGACEPECPVEAILPEDAIPDGLGAVREDQLRLQSQGIPEVEELVQAVRRRARHHPGRREGRVTKNFYMACLDVAGRRCLVVGGGAVGLEKAAGLLACGARVTVVSPELDEGFARARRRVASRARYRRRDLEGAFLVIAATSDRAVNERVHRDAEARGMLCNVADVPDLCNFILPAVHREGPIAVAVSTGGASPALAKRLRVADRRARRPRARRARRGAARAAARGQGALRDLRGAARLLRGRSSRSGSA